MAQKLRGVLGVWGIASLVVAQACGTSQHDGGHAAGGDDAAGGDAAGNAAGGDAAAGNDAIGGDAASGAAGADTAGSNAGPAGGSGAGAVSGTGGVGTAGEAAQAGRGASGGTGGVAGGAGSSACVHDSDCVNPDALNCVVSCGVDNGKPACIVQGADVDTDGFRSAKCAAAPGDDCNDGNSSIHPGAKDICDQLDNDCDGAVDLGGATLNLGGSANSYPQIAWSTDSPSAVYGVSFLDRTSKHWVFQTITQQEQIAVAQKTITDSSETPLVAEEFALAWGKGVFGFAAVHTVSTPSVLSFFSAKPDGTLTNPHDIASVMSDGNTPSITEPIITAQDMYWVLTYQSLTDSGRLPTQKAFTDPALVLPAYFGTPLTSTHAEHVSFATHPYENQALTLDSSGAAQVLIQDPGITGYVKQLPLSGHSPVLASTPAGYVVAVAGSTAADAPALYTFSVVAVPGCDSVKLPELGASPTSIANSANGYLVTFLGPSGLVVQEVNANCSVGRQTTVDSSAGISNAFISGTAATGNAVVWTRSDGVHFRAFGPTFCD